jgi:hypothetical protein
MTDGRSVGPAAPGVEEPPPAFEREGRLSVSEDWAATIFGLVLLVLVLAGVITGTFMKGLIP